jgi:hypothetical protein
LFFARFQLGEEPAFLSAVAGKDADEKCEEQLFHEWCGFVVKRSIIFFTFFLVRTGKMRFCSLEHCSSDELDQPYHPPAGDP